MKLFFGQNNIYKKRLQINHEAGFTLIEALVVLFIFSIITITFYSVFTLGSRFIIESKNHLGAVALANEKMETIRNLQYDDIGVVGGVPDGDIVAEENVIESQHSYHIDTFVQYVDDPFDGVSPTDLDYKRVKVTVSWHGARGSDSSISLVSRFVPPGIEQVLDGGTLAINVIGSNGVGVPQALVHITNSGLSPVVNLTAMTDDTGNLMLPGAKQSIQEYYISVTKSGYEYVETIDPNSVAYSVIDTPASVVDGMLNIKSIVQDRLAELAVTAVDYLGLPMSDVDFHIEGGRILGFDMSFSPAVPTYNLISDKTTDSNGKVELADISPGQFFISDINGIDGYTLIGLDNFSEFDSVNNKYTFLMAPGDSRETKIKFAKNDDNALLLKILKDVDNLPMAGAEAALTGPNNYSANQTVLADGVAFFPVTDVPLESGSYELKITADGYGEYNGTIEINRLTTQQIQLSAE